MAYGDRASIIHTPSLSPEFNAAELVFNKLKTVVKKEEFGPILHENVDVAVYDRSSRFHYF